MICRDWGQEEKGTTEDEMAGWHHRLNGHEFEWTPGDGDGQAWRAAIHGVAKSRTKLSDWTELNWTVIFLNNFKYRLTLTHMEIILLPPQWYTRPQKHNFSFGSYWRILARDSLSNGTILKWMTNTLIFTSFKHNLANKNTYLFSPVLFPYFSPKTWRDGLVLQSS